MSITVSGRVVKRSHKLSGTGQMIKTRQIVRALRRAKAPAPWAGHLYWLTDTGADIAAESARRREEQRVQETLSDIRDRYSTVRDGNTLVMTGACLGDYVLLEIETGDSDDPGPRCLHQGGRASLPNVAYELAAQLWLSEQKGCQ